LGLPARPSPRIRSALFDDIVQYKTDQENLGCRPEDQGDRRKYVPALDQRIVSWLAERHGQCNGGQDEPHVIRNPGSEEGQGADDNEKGPSECHGIEDARREEGVGLQQEEDAEHGREQDKGLNRPGSCRHGRGRSD